jgi:hypothetical protein
MNVAQWLKDFREMHERGRKKQLSPEEQRAYMAFREQFARSLVSAQGMAVESGQSARRTFRVAQGLQLELNLAAGSLKVVTLDLSCGGFSCLMHRPPDDKDEPGFSLKLPGGVEPLVGRARVVTSTRRIGNVRVSFAFKDLPERELERLETALFDMALERLPK